MSSLIKFKGSPYVFKRRSQPIHTLKHGPTSVSSPGIELSHSSIPSNPAPNDLDSSIAIRKGISTQHPLANYISFHQLLPRHKSFLSSLDSIVIPKTVNEALKDQNWTQAMREEMRALEKNQM